MAWVGATLAGLLTLKCPHCGLVQVRGRKPRGARFRCRACRRLFDRVAGSPPELAGLIGVDRSDDE